MVGFSPHRRWLAKLIQSICSSQISIRDAGITNKVESITECQRGFVCLFVCTFFGVKKSVIVSTNVHM